MIQEKDILFVTTSIYSKWLDYQQRIIKSLFPESQVLVVDGRNNWPVSWFYWIEEVKKTNSKYFVHIDEDFFITSKKQILNCIEKLENENLDLLGCPDGYHHFRGANPIAINTFLMFGKLEKLRDINFQNIEFVFSNKGWMNNHGLIFNNDYTKDWKYNFKQNGDGKFDYEQEPYYAFMWKMKELGAKFDYLYPHFDERFKSTNPRLTEDSEDIGIHMWYTRQWNSPMDVWGLPNYKRYELVEDYLHKNNIV